MKLKFNKTYLRAAHYIVCKKLHQGNTGRRVFFSTQLNILHAPVSTYKLILSYMLYLSLEWTSIPKSKHTHTDTNTQASSHTYCLMCNLFSHAICTQMHVGTICVIWTYTLSMWAHITSHGFFALKSHITSFAARLWMKPGAILVVMCRLGLTGILWSKIWFQVKSGCRVQVQVKFRTNEMFALF